MRKFENNIYNSYDASCVSLELHVREPSDVCLSLKVKMKPQLLQLTSLVLMLYLFLETVAGQTTTGIQLKGTYRCDKTQDGFLQLHFRAIDLNERATHMVPVDEAGIEKLGVNCVSSGSIKPDDPFVVDIYVNYFSNQATNDCGMDTVNPSGSPRIYRWRFQARRVENNISVGTKFTLKVECSSDSLTNNIVSTLVKIDVKQLSIDPINEIYRIGADGVQFGSQLKYTGRFYPGQDDEEQFKTAWGIFIYDCYTGTNPEVTQNREKIIDNNGCLIPGAKYSPTSDFERKSQVGDSLFIVEAVGAIAQYVDGTNTIYCQCKRGYCLQENDQNCIKKCGNDPIAESTFFTDSTLTAFIEVKYEAVHELFGEDDLVPPIEKKTKGSEKETFHYIAKLIPGGTNTDTDLMSAKGFAVYNCRYSSDKEFPADQTTVFVDNNGCVVPGTDFSPDAEFMADGNLTDINEYYITSGKVKLKLQKKYKIYFKCDTIICKTENNARCDKFCGSAGSIDDVYRLGYKGLQWEISIKAEPRLTINPEDDVNRLGENSVQLDSILKFTGHFYPGEEPDAESQDAVGMFYVDCYSGTNPEVTRDREQIVDSEGCAISGAAYSLTSQFSRTSTPGQIPITIEASGARAQYIGDQNTVYIKCKRGYCQDVDDTCCQQRCGCTTKQTTVVSNTEDTDFILVRNIFAQRMLGTENPAHPLIPTIIAQEGDQVYLVTQHIPDGIGSDTELMSAKGFYVYNCWFSFEPTIPEEQSTLLVDADGCFVQSEFSADAEFIYDSTLFRANEYNEYYVRSGKITLSVQNKYTVYFKCDTAICLTENHQRCIQRCGVSDPGSNEHIKELGYRGLTTAISIQKNKRLSIDPEDETDRRGPNTVVVDAPLKYIGYLYPGDDINPSAVGYYYYNCYTGTNEDLTRDREQIIDEYGCIKEGAAKRPNTPFERTSTSGQVPFTLVASGARSQLINGRATIHVSCKIGYCLLETDDNCRKKCGNTPVPGSTFNTDIEHRGTIIVTDAEDAQQLVGTRQIITDPTVTVVRHGIVNTQIYLAAKFVPYGKGSTSVWQAAKGFFLYSCRYDNNPNVPDKRAKYIVDDKGCTVPNDLTPVQSFEFNSTLSNDYSYILTSGLVTLVDQDGYQVYFKCKTAVCLTENHPYCQKRCGATDGLGDVVYLGDSGMEYNIGIIKNDDPPLALVIKTQDGTKDLQTTGGFVGDTPQFGATIIPATATGDGGQFLLLGIKLSLDYNIRLSNAKGAFIYNCFATTNPSANVPEDEREYFIDADGCRIADNDFATSKECESNTDSQPFIIDCGTFEIKQKGNWRQQCSSGYCTDENNDYCKKRCQPGQVVPSTVVNANIPITSSFQAKDRNDRTAVVSEEKRKLLIALAVALPCVILIGVAIGAWCLVRAENAKR